MASSFPVATLRIRKPVTPSATPAPATTMPAMRPPLPVSEPAAGGVAGCDSDGVPDVPAGCASAGPVAGAAVAAVATAGEMVDADGKSSCNPTCSPAATLTVFVTTW